MVLEDPVTGARSTGEILPNFPGTTGRAEKWYARGLRFKCLRCGSCCRGEPGFVWVNDREVETLAHELRLQKDEFVSLYLREVAGRKSLRERPDGDCVFYDRGCKVYDVRPRQCRTFPFWHECLTSPEVWKVLLAGCPGAKKGPLVTFEEIEATLRQGLEEPLSDLAKVYEEVDQEIASLEVECLACGRCCHFSRFAHTLFVSSLELAFLLLGAGARVENGDVCPYLVGNRCSAREFRTLGCRTFFCRDLASETMQDLYHRGQRKIHEIFQRFNLTWTYRPLEEHLRQFARSDTNETLTDILLGAFR